MTDPNSTQAALVALTLFRSDRRVQILRLLQDEDTPVGCADIASQLQSESAQRDRTDLIQALHHAHLPAMDDAGVVEYDTEHRRITAFDEARFETLLETTRSICESLDADD